MWFFTCSLLGEHLFLRYYSERGLSYCKEPRIYALYSHMLVKFVLIITSLYL
jgi:hypothetical protein